MEQEKEMFEYRIADGSASILRSFRQGVVRIPEAIDGYPVRELADYAFAAENGGELLEELYLPQTVRRLGRYVFYNCRKLSRLSFYSGLCDVGAGAFTGCHHLEELEITVLGNTAACLREILLELPEELRVWYHTPEGTARLLFPEYFEEGVENTPARILETHIHGSGMYYRNCFAQKQLLFAEYDKRFSKACAQETPEFLIELAFARVRYPLQLSKEAFAGYQQFLKENRQEAGKWCLDRQDMPGLIWLERYGSDTRQTLEALLEYAAQIRYTEAVGYLQELLHKKYPKKKQEGRFAL